MKSKQISNIKDWAKLRGKKAIKFMAFFLSLVTFALPTVARGEQGVLIITNLTAAALISNLEDCVYTNVLIFAGDDVYHQPPLPPSSVTGSGAYIFIDQEDICKNTILLSASGFNVLEEEAFQADKGIKSATLNTIFEVVDNLSGTSFPVTVDLNWAGTKGVTSETERDHYRTANILVNSNMTGIFRSAAVSGSIVSNGVTQLLTKNSVIDVAYIARIRNGRIEINFFDNGRTLDR